MTEESMGAYLLGLASKAGRLDKAIALVNKQTLDEGLWLPADTVVEAYIQQALRDLHAAIEEIHDD